MSNKEVVVFGRSVPECAGCVAVTTALNNNNINYIYKDTSDEEAYNEMCKLRVRGIPAVFVDGVFKKGVDNIHETIKEILE